jgi:hypothetical protein
MSAGLGCAAVDEDDDPRAAASWELHDAMTSIVDAAHDGDNDAVRCGLERIERWGLLAFEWPDLFPHIERDLAQAHLMWSAGRRADAIEILSAWSA